ncbi:uncharacterized protein LOC130285559 isoform X2 [Hyla sarda]|uniref:uncharacterized protein LOC130285559 isoform X2 n=1 Tax=Hyla sarda TaxID=327740 RepID=UPI0024C41755|nr:uncharacterized protein LOC130285559 isoform X2 [Hyla sarda]
MRHSCKVKAAPRMHIGLVELWLRFRKLQKFQDETWRKMKRMMRTMRTMRTTSASCQELKDKVRDTAVQVPERLGTIEKRVEIIDGRMKNMEDAHKEECANRTHHLEEKKISDQLPKKACHGEPRAISALGPGRGRASTTQLAHKVAALTELLNGHNELLVELYQRMTELEGTRRAKVTLQDGSGDGR